MKKHITFTYDNNDYEACVILSNYDYGADADGRRGTIKADIDILWCEDNSGKKVDITQSIFNAINEEVLCG